MATNARYYSLKFKFVNPEFQEFFSRERSIVRLRGKKKMPPDLLAKILLETNPFILREHAENPHRTVTNIGLIPLANAITDISIVNMEDFVDPDVVKALRAMTLRFDAGNGISYYAAPSEIKIKVQVTALNRNDGKEDQFTITLPRNILSETNSHDLKRAMRTLILDIVDDYRREPKNGPYVNGADRTKPVTWSDFLTLPWHFLIDYGVSIQKSPPCIIRINDPSDPV